MVSSEASERESLGFSEGSGSRGIAEEDSLDESLVRNGDSFWRLISNLFDVKRSNNLLHRVFCLWKSHPASGEDHFFISAN